MHTKKKVCKYMECFIPATAIEEISQLHCMQTASNRATSKTCWDGAMQTSAPCHSALAEEHLQVAFIVLGCLHFMFCTQTKQSPYKHGLLDLPCVQKRKQELVHPCKESCSAALQFNTHISLRQFSTVF